MVFYSTFISVNFCNLYEIASLRPDTRVQEFRLQRTVAYLRLLILEFQLCCRMQTWTLHDGGNILAVLDPLLMDEPYPEEEVIRVTEIALLCTQSLASMRPSMSHVVSMLIGESEVKTSNATKPSIRMFSSSLLPPSRQGSLSCGQSHSSFHSRIPSSTQNGSSISIMSPRWSCLHTQKIPKSPKSRGFLPPLLALCNICYAQCHLHTSGIVTSLLKILPGSKAYVHLTNSSLSVLPWSIHLMYSLRLSALLNLQ